MTTELDFGQPQISAEQQKWQDRAVLLADKCKIDISVIRDSGTFQLWPSSKAGVGVYCAKYSDVDSTSDGDMANDIDKDGAK